MTVDEFFNTAFTEIFDRIELIETTLSSIKEDIERLEILLDRITPD